MKNSSVCSCSRISFEEMEQLLCSGTSEIQTECPFVLPFWLQLWKSIFAPETPSFLVKISQGNALIGIAPLKLDGDAVCFMGHEELFDYQDVIVQPGKEEQFFNSLLLYLTDQGVQRLELGALRPDSNVYQFMPSIARATGYEISHADAGSLYLMDLPSSWQRYLQRLDGKQRHEIRRKFRRIEEAGSLQYREISGTDGLGEWIELFFRMFQASREDKERFLNKRMRLYFEGLAKQLATRGMLRSGTLLLDDRPIAATFGFFFHKTYYLYNNGYSPRFSGFSPGLLCKAMGIRKNIGNEVAVYNFLKGKEPYKKHLGGWPVPLMRLTIDLAAGGRR